MGFKTQRMALPVIAAACLCFIQAAAQGGRGVRLPGHVPHQQIGHAHHLGHVITRETVNLAFTLKPRDSAGLEDFLKRVNDPADPEYHRFLTPAEYKDRFAPTASDVLEITNFLAASGFSNIVVHDNNHVVDASAPVQTVERAFQLEMHQYTLSDGRRVRAPSDDPLVTEQMALRLNSITGLSTMRRWHAHKAKKQLLDPNGAASPMSIASHMTPAKIKSAYNLSTAANAGSGETLALFELDGYNASDINTYTSYFSITAPTLQNILVDGASGSAGSATDEVCLDIELAMAIAPGLAKIQVYEGPNTDSGVIDTYNRIATDNTANEISTSWGSSEDGDTQSFMDSENTIFQQMAAQGQSIFAAAGDAGAFDDSSNPALLTVDDPGSQPYMTSVGGTTLTLAGTAYASETSWGNSAAGIGGGGGVSAVWSQPSWQNNLAAIANKGSHTRRMVPDVSLDADPNTGYSIYTEGNWFLIGGTSAAAPLWAAFMAQVNSARVANSLPRVGFANTALYQIGQSSLYATVFHDIADNSTNLYFPAVTGYDLSTGWGSFNGANLLAALASATLPPYAPATVQTAGNGVNSVTVSWNASTGATSYDVYRSTSFNGVYTLLGNTAALNKTDNTAGVTGYYYYVVAKNAAGSSAPSAKRAGAANLATPASAGGMSGGGAP